MSNLQKIRESIQESAALKTALAEDTALHARIEEAAEYLCEAFLKGGRVLFCGNGGSAADAQHFAAELTGKFLFERKALDAEALHTNSSYITAYANDQTYEGVFARLVQAKGRAGDVLFGISTSGNSQNILLAFAEAKRIGMKTIALTGAGGGRMRGEADILLSVPSSVTPRIQECHILVGHIICQLVEARCM
jgi:D-sedoheptulose 7-phosphate isomerase